jgi:hypothetical protein
MWKARPVVGSAVGGMHLLRYERLFTVLISEG